MKRTFAQVKPLQTTLFILTSARPAMKLWRRQGFTNARQKEGRASFYALEEVNM